MAHKILAGTWNSGIQVVCRILIFYQSALYMVNKISPARYVDKRKAMARNKVAVPGVDARLKFRFRLFGISHTS
jgi:hypothetical protein